MAKNRKQAETPEQRVDDAMKTSNGQVPMTVVFPTQEEVDAAAWHAKGQEKAEKLRFVTREQLDREWRDLKAKWARENVEAAGAEDGSGEPKGGAAKKGRKAA